MFTQLNAIRLGRAAAALWILRGLELSRALQRKYLTIVLSGKEEQICCYYRFAVVNFFLSSESFSIMLNAKLLANSLIKTEEYW